MSTIKFNGYDTMEIITTYGSKEQITANTEVVPTQIRDVISIQFPVTTSVDTLRAIAGSKDSLSDFDLTDAGGTAFKHQNYVLFQGIEITNDCITLKLAQLTSSDVNMRNQNNLAETIADGKATQILELIKDLYAEIDALKAAK